jgi:integrase
MTFKSNDSPYWIAEWTDELGRRHRTSTKKRTKREADVVEADLRVKADRIRMGLEVRERNPDRLTVAQAALWWWDEIASKQAQGADGRLWQVVDRHIVADLGTLPLDRVTPGVVNSWLHGKIGGPAEGSRNHLRAYLMSIFSRAIEHERWRGVNPVKQTKRIAADDPDGKALPAHYVWPLLLCAPTESWLLAIAIAAYTGLRRDEITRVFGAPGWPAVDLDARVAVIRKSGNANKKGRRVALHVDLVELLKRMRDAKVGLPGSGALPRSAVIVRTALARAGIDDDKATFHGLRGAWSDRLEECGARESVVDFMGWGKSTTSTRRRHYKRLTDEVLRREIDKLTWPIAAEEG